VTEPTAQPALAAFLDFATTTRPDIDRRDLEGALWAWHEAGRTWGQTIVAATQMLARGEEPRDLRIAATARPWERPRKDYDRA
jgi:hypothetical protein